PDRALARHRVVLARAGTGHPRERPRRLAADPPVQEDPPATARGRRAAGEDRRHAGREPAPLLRHRRDGALLSVPAFGGDLARRFGPVLGGPGRMHRTGPGFCSLLALAALPARVALATVASDVCPATADPCVVSSAKAVDPGSTLDFGSRALDVRATCSLV